jgi:hypothetical protein
MVQVKLIKVEWDNAESIEYSTNRLLYDYKTCKRIFKTLLETIKEKENKS